MSLLGSLEFEFKPVADSFLRTTDQVLKSVKQVSAAERDLDKQTRSLNLSFNNISKAVGVGAGAAGLTAGLLVLNKRYDLLSKAQSGVEAGATKLNAVLKTSTNIFAGLKDVAGGFGVAFKRSLKGFEYFEAGIAGLSPKFRKLSAQGAALGAVFTALGTAASTATGPIGTLGTVVARTGDALTGLISSFSTVTSWIGIRMVTAGQRLRAANEPLIEQFSEWEQVLFGIRAAVDGYNARVGASVATLEHFEKVIKETSSTTGMLRSEIAQGVLTLMEFSSVTGLTEKEIRKLTVAAAEYSQTTGQDFQTVIRGIDNAFRGYTRTLQTVGISLTSANIEQTVYAKSLGKTTKELSVQEKATAVTESLLEKFAFTAGKSAEFLNTTYYGALQRIQAAQQNLAIEIGRGATEITRFGLIVRANLIEVFNEVMPEKVLAYFGAFREAKGIFNEVIGSAIALSGQIILLTTAFAALPPVIAALAGPTRVALAALSALAAKSEIVAGILSGIKVGALTSGIAVAGTAILAGGAAAYGLKQIRDRELATQKARSRSQNFSITQQFREEERARRRVIRAGGTPLRELDYASLLKSTDKFIPPEETRRAYYQRAPFDNFNFNYATPIIGNLLRLMDERQAAKFPTSEPRAGNKTFFQKLFSFGGPPPRPTLKSGAGYLEAARRLRKTDAFSESELPFITEGAFRVSQLSDRIAERRRVGLLKNVPKEELKAFDESNLAFGSGFDRYRKVLARVDRIIESGGKVSDKLIRKLTISAELMQSLGMEVVNTGAKFEMSEEQAKDFMDSLKRSNLEEFISGLKELNNEMEIAFSESRWGMRARLIKQAVKEAGGGAKSWEDLSDEAKNEINDTMRNVLRDSTERRAAAARAEIGISEGEENEETNRRTIEERKRQLAYSEAELKASKKLQAAYASRDEAVIASTEAATERELALQRLRDEEARVKETVEDLYASEDAKGAEAYRIEKAKEFANAIAQIENNYTSAMQQAAMAREEFQRGLSLIQSVGLDKTSPLGKKEFEFGTAQTREQQKFQLSQMDEMAAALDSFDEERIARTRAKQDAATAKFAADQELARSKFEADLIRTTSGIPGAQTLADNYLRIKTEFYDDELALIKRNDEEALAAIKREETAYVNLSERVEQGFAAAVAAFALDLNDKSLVENFSRVFDQLWLEIIETTIRNKMNLEAKISKNIFEDPNGLVNIFKKAGSFISDIFGGVSDDTAKTKKDSFADLSGTAIRLSQKEEQDRAELVQALAGQQSELVNTLKREVLSPPGKKGGRVTGEIWSQPLIKLASATKTSGPASGEKPVPVKLATTPGQTTPLAKAGGFLSGIGDIFGSTLSGAGSAMAALAPYVGAAKMVAGLFGVKFDTKDPTKYGMTGALGGAAGAKLIQQFGTNMLPSGATVGSLGGGLGVGAASAGAGFVGGFLGNLVTNALFQQNKGTQIGSSVGTAGGAAGGAAIGSMIAPGPGTVIGAGIGSFLGSILGGGIGSLFGKTEWQQMRESLGKSFKGQVRRLMAEGVFELPATFGMRGEGAGGDVRTYYSDLFGQTIKDKKKSPLKKIWENSGYHGIFPSDETEKISKERGYLPFDVNDPFIFGRFSKSGKERLNFTEQLGGNAATSQFVGLAQLYRTLGGVDKEVFGNKRNFFFYGQLAKTIAALGFEAQKARQFMRGLARTLAEDLDTAVTKLNKKILKYDDDMEKWADQKQGSALAFRYTSQLGALIDGFAQLSPYLDGMAVAQDLVASRFEKVTRAAIDFGTRTKDIVNPEIVQQAEALIPELAQKIRSGEISLEQGVKQINEIITKIDLTPLVLSDETVLNFDALELGVEQFLVSLDEIKARIEDISKSGESATQAFGSFLDAQDFTSGFASFFQQIASGVKEATVSGISEAMIQSGPIGIVLADFITTLRTGIQEGLEDTELTTEEVTTLGDKLRESFGDAVDQFYALTPVFKQLFDLVKDLDEIFENITGDRLFRLFQTLAQQVRAIQESADSALIRASELQKTSTQFTIPIERAQARTRASLNFLGIPDSGLPGNLSKLDTSTLAAQFALALSKIDRTVLSSTEIASIIGGAQGDSRLVAALDNLRTGMVKASDALAFLRSGLPDIANIILQNSVGLGGGAPTDLSQFGSLDQLIAGLQGLSENINELYEAEANKIRGEAQLRSDIINDQIEAIRREGELAQRVSDKKLKTWEKELEQASRWAGIVSSINDLSDDIKNRLLRVGSSKTVRMNELTNKLSVLFQQFEGATDDERKARIASKIVDLENERLSLAEQWFQRPSFEFQTILQKTVDELERVKAVAYGDEDRVFELQKLISDESKRTSDLLEIQNNKIDEYNDALYAIQKETKTALDTLGLSFGKIMAWVGGTLNEALDVKLERLKVEFGDDDIARRLLYDPLGAVAENSQFMKELLEQIAKNTGGLPEDWPTAASGGLVHGPTKIIAGDTPSGWEALIPLPSGGAIPVEIRDRSLQNSVVGGSSMINAPLNVGITINATGAMTPEQISRLSSRIQSDIEASVRTGRIKSVISERFT